MTSGNDSASAIQAIDACVAHARQMLESQLPIVDARNYDFAPGLKEMGTQIYLAGVMWRFGEQFDLPTAAHERGFLCLSAMLISDGMNPSQAQKRVAQLYEMSRTPSANYARGIMYGYNATKGDGSLAALLDMFRDAPEVSGARFRFINRWRLVAAILAVAGVVISLVLNRSWGEAIGVGVVLGVVTVAIAMVGYHQKVK